MLLNYKSQWYGKTLIKINRFYPSSKKCSNCCYLNNTLKLSDRFWNCKKCNSYHDRDLNASINILKEGLRLLSAGTVEYTDGDINKPLLQGINLRSQ